MSNGNTSWYLQKKGKYYGPFSSEKILDFLQSGKVEPTILVARDRDGSDAAPLKDIPEFSGSAPVSSANKGISPALAKAPKKAIKPNSDEPYPKVWCIRRDGRDFGPYDLQHLQLLRDSGKVNGETKVVHSETGQETTIGALLVVPVTKKPTQTVPAPKNSARGGGAREPRAPIYPVPKKRFGRLAVAAMVLVVVAVLGLLVWDMRRKPQMVENLLDPRVSDGATLRDKIDRSDPPPYGDLVQFSLGEALNFSEHDIRTRLSSFSMITVAEDRIESPFLQRYMTQNPPARQFTLQGDGGYHFTFLFDRDFICYAVFIQHENFNRKKLAHQDVSAFSHDAFVKKEAWGERWVYEVGEGISAQVVWQRGDEGSYYMDVVYVDDPRVKNEGAL